MISIIIWVSLFFLLYLILSSYCNTIKNGFTHQFVISQRLFYSINYINGHLGKNIVIGIFCAFLSFCLFYFYKLLRNETNKNNKFAPKSRDDSDTQKTYYIFVYEHKEEEVWSIRQTPTFKTDTWKSYFVLFDCWTFTINHL